MMAVPEPFIVVLVEFDMSAVQDASDANAGIEKVRPAIAVEDSRGEDFNRSPVGRIKVGCLEVQMFPQLP